MIDDLLYDLYIQRRCIEGCKKKIECLEVWAKDSFGLSYNKKNLAYHEEAALKLMKDFIKNQDTELVEN